MVEFIKNSSGDCNECNTELCTAICYQRYAKLFDDKYKYQCQENEPELANPIVDHKS